MHTIHDVAKLAGVSVGTVSNVINNRNKVSTKTIAAVEKAIQELHYIPNTLAKSLKTNSSRVIGILAEDVSAFSSGDIIDGICEYCETHDYAINLCNLRMNHMVYSNLGFVPYSEIEATPTFKTSVSNNLNTLLTSRVCGLIYIGIHPRDVSKILPPLDIPVVYTYAYTEGEDYCVNYDDYQGAALATNHLIQGGHHDIGLICGPIDSVPAHKRMMGYQTALMENRLSFRSEYIKAGNWSYDDGYNDCLSLIQMDSVPSAIFAMNDLMACGAIDACLDNNLRVPEDISIHGFDNLELAGYTKPPLTTIELPLHEMGIESARVMDALLADHPPTSRNILIDCKHIIRNSATATISS